MPEPINTAAAPAPNAPPNGNVPPPKAPLPEPKTDPKPPEPRKYKVRGQEISDADPDHQALLEMGHDYRSGTRDIKQGMTELDRRRKALAEREAALLDPKRARKVLEDAGIDYRQWLETQAAAEWEAEQLSPEQKALREVQKEREELVAEREAMKQAQEEQEIAHHAREFAQVLNTRLPEALKAADLLGDPEALEGVHGWLASWSKVRPLTAEDIPRAVQMVEKRLQAQLAKRAASLDTMEKRMAFLGEALYKAVERDNYEAWKAKNKPAPSAGRPSPERRAPESPLIRTGGGNFTALGG